MLDLICRRYYGTERGGTVEAVLEANTGLAELGPVLPAGVLITLPELQAPAQAEQPIRLWS